MRAIFDERGGCGGGDAVGVRVRAAGSTVLPGLGVLCSGRERVRDELYNHP